MIRILLDTNIFDRLASDETQRLAITELVGMGKISVIVSRTVAEELHNPPFLGIPEFFPFRYVSNTVGRVGIMRAGDSIGSGSVFYEHLGNSKKTNDALVVDAASWHADWLVSEDYRLRERAKKILERVSVLTYEEFKDSLEKLESI